MKTKYPHLPGWATVPISVVTWIFFVFFTVVCFFGGLILMAPISLLFSPKTRYWIHLVAVTWARCIVHSSFLWRVHVEGAENIEPGKHYVIAANHQSMMDIMSCLCGLPIPFKFLAKKELFSIPCVGWHMSLSGYIPLDRSSRASGKNALERSREWLQKGVSVLFYPEGTRSKDGQIKAYKMGAFKLAAEEEVEVLPVVLDGTREGLAKHSWRFDRFAVFKVSIGKPVKLPKGDTEGILRKKEEIREEMSARLAKMRNV